MTPARVIDSHVHLWDPALRGRKPALSCMITMGGSVPYVAGRAGNRSPYMPPSTASAVPVVEAAAGDAR
jgi:hypothetical protein